MKWFSLSPWLILCTACQADGTTTDSRASIRDWHGYRANLAAEEAEQKMFQGDLASARQALSKAQARGADGSEIHRIWAQIQLSEGRLNQAEWHLDMALNEAPNNPELNRLKGELFEMRGNWEEAGEAFAAAASANPNDLDSILAQARTLLANNEAVEAAELLDRAQSWHSDSMQLTEKCGQAHLAAGDPAKAAQAFRAVVEFNPNNHATARLLCRALCQAGSHTEAAEVFASLGAYGTPGLQLMVAQSLLTGGEPYQAQTLLKAYLSEVDQDAGAWMDLARASFLQEEYGAAAEAAMRCLALDPESSAAHVILGHVCLNGEDHTGAMEAYRTAIQLGADQSELQPFMHFLSTRTKGAKRIRDQVKTSSESGGTT